MKRIVCFILCLVLIICFCSCASQDEHSNKSPVQMAAERLDPEGLMIPETFQMDQRDVAKASGILTKPDENPKTTYYGSEASIMYNIKYSTVDSVSYFLGYLDTDSLKALLPTILNDATTVYGEPHFFYINNSYYVDSIDLESLYEISENRKSQITKWIWKFEDYDIQIGLLLPSNIIIVEYTLPALY